MASKRPNGEGTIYQRTDGRWCCRVSDGVTKDGKPRYKWLYGKTRREVLNALSEVRRDADDGIAGGDTPFSVLADLWYEEHRDEVSPQTYDGYRYTKKILIDHFTDTPIKNIRALDIERFLRGRRDSGASKSQVSKLRGMMFQIMNMAVANKLVRDNPVASAKPTRYKDAPPNSSKDSFTAEEIDILMRELPITKMGLTIRVMLGTGLRTQEMIALQQEHIAADGSVVRVRQAVKMLRGKPYIGPPKSRDGYRDIPVPEAIRPFLIALRRQGEKFIWNGRLPDSVINPSSFRSAYTRTLTNIEDVRALSPHCCRHTYISQLQAKGVDIETIRVLAGHADIEMTEHYMHIQDETKKSAVQRLDGLFKIS